MEFCAGGDLIDRLECTRGERPLSEITVVRFLQMLCHALHHVHSCGMLHRDLKSSNIFVAAHDRTVKLGDFGLACLGLSPRRLTGSPRRMSRCGTAMYMSPEVADRKPYGATSDTYGLGCVLLEMLLRRQLRERRPFEARKDYITEALARGKAHGWATFDDLASLAWRMLDENPKTRIALPAAAAAAAAIVQRHDKATCAGGATADSAAAASSADLHALKALYNSCDGDGASAGMLGVRPGKRAGALDERTRRLPGHIERRRRLQYAD